MLTLIRYNLRVVLANNWWLLVFPIAVSQLTVFWNIITRKFTTSLPAESAEMVTPLLAAFLCAHLLTAEYQSRVGAIIASKPLNIGKLVLFRLSAVLALVWALEMASLAAYYYGMQQYDILTPFVASIPSTLFLSMLAMTFATMFRNPMAGFGIAGLYWCLDLPPGPPVNAFLSLRSYSTFLSSVGPNLDGLVSPWWVAKALLLLGAVVLYVINGRQVFRLGTASTARAKLRSFGGIAGILAVYLLSGASAKVAYGYAQRGQLQPNDGTWFRRQFGPFGPIPISVAFGPAFRRYVGDSLNSWHPQTEEGDLLGDTVKHHRELREVLDHMPNSIWAPSAAELLGRLTSRQGQTVEDRVSIFQHVADRYPGSPYVDVALREIAMIYDGAEQQDLARREYEELLKRRPTSRFRSESLRYIVQNDRTHGDYVGMLKWARAWSAAAPPQEKFVALIAQAQGLRATNDSAGAHEAAKEAREAAAVFLTSLRNGQVAGSASSLLRWERSAREAMESARLYK